MEVMSTTILVQKRVPFTEALKRDKAVMMTVQGKYAWAAIDIEVFRKVQGILEAYYLTNKDYLEPEAAVHLKDLLKTMDCPTGYAEETPEYDPTDYTQVHRKYGVLNGEED